MMDHNAELVTHVDINDGYIKLVDVMGSDADICRAARKSYGKDKGDISDPVKDRRLIRYLMRKGHTSPFEMVELKFMVKCPMDVWRQWIRHRTASVNEYSTRYSIAIDEIATTSSDKWRLQAEDNKQGSSDEYVDYSKGSELTKEERQLHEHARQVYKHRLEVGVAKEQARKDLPLSTYTEAVWKIDLHNLLHFLKLRMDASAQYEIREYALAIYKILEKRFPMTFDAFKEYCLCSMSLTTTEVSLLRGLIDKYVPKDYDLAELRTQWDTLNPEVQQMTVCREFRECVEKFSLLGVDFKETNDEGEKSGESSDRS